MHSRKYTHKRELWSYVPPHRRGHNTDVSPRTVVPRSLDEVSGASRLEIRLRVPANNASAFGNCPFVVEEERSRGEVSALGLTSSATHTSGLLERVIQFPRLWSEEHALELLEWFEEFFLSAINADSGPQVAELCLPTSFSKDERKEWHRFAERRGLQTESTGTGSSRRLTVRARPPFDSGSAPGKLPEVSKEAKQIWKWCQSEGGAFWQLSQGEIACMLSSPGGLPGNLKELCDQRRLAQELIDSLRRGDSRVCLSLLEQARQQGGECVNRLVWNRDDRSGGYPIHIAARKGLVDVVEALAGMPNVLTQKDKNWLTVFDVCEDQRTCELLCRLRAET